MPTTGLFIVAYIAAGEAAVPIRAVSRHSVLCFEHLAGTFPPMRDRCFGLTRLHPIWKDYSQQPPLRVLDAPTITHIGAKWCRFGRERTQPAYKQLRRRERPVPPAAS